MKNYTLALLAVVFSFSTHLRADDIEPAGKFGYVTVRLPDEAKALYGSKFSATFGKVDGGQTKIATPDTPFRVFSGTGCLTISGAADTSYRVKRCDFTVVEKQTLTIDLSLAKLSWAMTNLQVDIGPFPQFGLAVSDAATKLESLAARAYRDMAPNQLFLLFPGQYEARYDRVGPLDNQGVPFSLQALTAHAIDISPKDLRSTIQVTAEGLKYESPRRNYIFVNRIVVLERDVANSPKDIIANVVSNAAFSNKTITLPAASTPTINESFKAFAIGQSEAFHRHEIVVNNIIVPVSLIPGQTSKTDLVPFNVNHIDGTKKGFFRVAQLDPTPGVAERPIRWQNENSLLLSEEKPTFAEAEDDAASRNTYFRTRKTILVPRGHQYRVDTYAFDELNDFQKQDSHAIDLR